MRAIAAAIALFSLAVPAAGQVLLEDHFDGTALDTTKWFVPTGDGTFFGRTQIRPPSEPLTVAGGVLRLQVDTWNPTALVPGDSFWGSEVDSLDTWAVEDGLSFRARVRLVAPVPGGLVGALFSYVFLPGIPGRDEIDFELLTNDVVAAEERVLTNVFDDDDFGQAGDFAFAQVAGLDLTDFHVYEVRWYPDRVEWYVDGSLLRTETDTVPGDPQNVRLNFWVPDAGFAAAYDASLQPAADSGDNETFFYEVDQVRVARISSGVPALPRFAWALLAAVLVATGWGMARPRWRSPARTA